MMTVAPDSVPGVDHRRVQGLYAIADGGCLGTRDFARSVEQALRGGAGLIQYRDKHAAHDERQRRALALVQLCDRYAVPLIVNDDPALALRVGAAGVHLGKEDGDVLDARALLGWNAIIGVSCYNEFERAERAAAAGADYVAFGRVYASRTKPAAVHAGLNLLCRARAELAVSVVAIGGITPDNGAAVITAGADAIAVIEGVFGQPDIYAAAGAYARLFLPN